MLLEQIAERLSVLAETIVLKDHLAFTLLSLCSILLLTWRVWTFTIRPMMYSDDPKHLPYWIPGFGHAMGFFNNSYNLITLAEKYFGNTKEPYSVEVMGNTIYIVTDPNDASEVYKNNSTMSFEIFVRKFMMSCGASPALLQVLFEPPEVNRAEIDTAAYPNPKRQSLGVLTHDFHNIQLIPGGHLEEFTSVTKKEFENKLNLNKIKREFYAVQQGQNQILVQLLKLVSDFFVDVGQRTFFGDLLSEQNPDLTWVFLELEDRSWQILYDLPHFLAYKAHEARDKIIWAIQVYFETPIEQRGKTSWWIKTMETEMKALGFTSKEMATVVMPIYIGSNTSTRKACFWMIAFMITNPTLMDIVREETKPAMIGDTLDLEYLRTKCPQLNAIWMETLRTATSAASFRFLTEDTRIGGKTLRRGNRVLIPSRQLHYDADAFGDDVSQFNPDRLLRNAKKWRQSWRPFGGGVNKCPGRIVAQLQTFMFVTLLVHRFDIELAGPQKFPRWAEGDPFPGMMPTKDGDDLLVRLTVRTAPS